MTFEEASYLLESLPTVDIFKRDKDYINFACPVCMEGKSLGSRYRAYLLPGSSAYVYCHNCGYSATFEKFLSDINVNNKDSIDILDIRFRSMINSLEREKERHEQSRKREKSRFYKNYIPAVSSKKVVSYLKSRSIDEQFIRQWYTDKREDKVIIPILDEDFKPIAIQYRRIDRKEFKIVKYDKRYKAIYNFYNLALFRPLPYLIVTESIFDAVVIQQLGFIYTIALLGLYNFTSEIVSSAEKIYILLDQDQAGVDAAEKLKKRFRSSKIKFIQWDYPYKDSSEFYMKDRIELYRFCNKVVGSSY